MDYFAYGSNMLGERLRLRASSAITVGRALLRGHRLRFNKRGRDGSGKCNLEPTGRPEEVVHGVVFQVDEAQVGLLDEAEDVSQGGYSRRSVRVELGGRATRVQTYFAGEAFVEASLRVFDWYGAFVLAGAVEHGLERGYCRAIASVSTVRDPDEERRRLALDCLGRFRADFESGRLLERWR